MPRRRARPTALLYWPARFPPNLEEWLNRWPLEITRLTASSPCDVTRDRRIRPSDTQESAKVLCTVGDVGKINAKANGGREKTGEDKWPTQPQLIGKVGKGQQNDRWEKFVIGNGGLAIQRMNALATAYGGTVRRFEIATV